MSPSSSAIPLTAAAAALVLCAGQAQAQTCQRSVEGRIAWGDQADWPQDKLAALCEGAESSVEPGRCFGRLMSGEVDWGGGTRWVPDNALALCGGTTDAAATISCFEDRIAAGDGWREGIASCSADGTTTSPSKLDAKVPSGVSEAVGAAAAREALRQSVSSGEDDAGTGPVVPSEYHGQRDVGAVHLIERRFSITLSDCLAHLERAGVGHVWRCDREFEVEPGGFIYNPDAVFRVTYSDLSADCRVTVKPRRNGISAELTHARQTSGGPTISETDARRCMSDAFEAEGIDDRTFTIRLLTTRP